MIMHAFSPLFPVSENEFTVDNIELVGVNHVHVLCA